MKKIAISVPSGSHHRALVQPLREKLIQKNDWQYVIISPGSPWADEIFPPEYYPRDRFSFEEIKRKEFYEPAYLETLRAAISRHNINFLLTTTTGRDSVDRPLLEIAADLDIPAATYIESWDNVWKMARKREEQIIPEHLIVWNSHMQKHLLEEFPEIPAASVYVTGAPRLDKAARKENLPQREELFRTLGLDPNKRLLHFSTVELYDMDHVGKDIGEARKKGKLPSDLQLLATVHPGGNIDKQKEWADRWGFALRHTFGRHKKAPHADFLYNPSPRENELLFSLFREEDILINFSSTVALEAMLMDTPVIGVKYGKKLDWWNWRNSAVIRDFREHYANLTRAGGIKIVKSREQLVRNINEYLAHPERDRKNRRESCQAIMSTLEGDATEKTFAVLEEIIG